MFPRFFYNVFLRQLWHQARDNSQCVKVSPLSLLLVHARAQCPPRQLRLLQRKTFLSLVAGASVEVETFRTEGRDGEHLL